MAKSCHVRSILLPLLLLLLQKDGESRIGISYKRFSVALEPLVNSGSILTEEFYHNLLCQEREAQIL